jgi:hypothetical protein
MGLEALTSFAMDSKERNAYRLDKAKVIAAFNAAAATYEREAVLQRMVAERLMKRLDLIEIARFDSGCRGRHWAWRTSLGAAISSGEIDSARCGH